MKKILFILALVLLFAIPSQATTYYLSPSGNDGWSGDAGNPWLTPNHALNCGDVIIAAAGTYSAWNFIPGDWGTVTCPAENDVAWLKCETFGECVISTDATSAIQIDESFWGVQGWKVSSTAAYGTCLGVIPDGGSTIHHIIIANNIVDGCNSSIPSSPQSTTAGVDYLIIAGNIIYDGAQSVNLCNSGISVYEPVKYDSKPGTHIYLAGNFSFDNYSPSGCGSGETTWDGNGIVLDDIGWVQGGGTPYDQQIVVENNIAVFNGGSGYGNTGDGTTASNIYYRYNTAYGNFKATNTDTTSCGDFLLMDSSYTNLYRNIVQSTTEHACLSSTQDHYAVAANTCDATSTVAGNWLHGVNGQYTVLYNNDGFAYGSNVTGTSPNFANPVDPGQPNCSGKTNTVDCMATLIANYTPQAEGANIYGYQPVTGYKTYDQFFPEWLCSVTNFPTGIIDMRCGRGITVGGGSLTVTIGGGAQTLTLP